MRRSESLIFYSGKEKGSSYYISVYESVPDFSRREFFEHKHPDFEISYILDGEGEYSFLNGKCKIAQGDLFIMGSNQVHCITKVDEKRPIVLLNVRFEPRMIWSPSSNTLGEEYLELFNGKCGKLDRKSEQYENIVEKMLQINREAQEKKTGYPIMIKSYLCEIFAYLMRNYGDMLRKEKPKASSFDRLMCMDRAVTYINEHLADELTLEEIARVSGLSRTYFSSVFTALNGLKPWDYITIKRIEKSKSILSETDVPVIEVALKCGYENISNFNRMFRRIVGMSPSEYRKIKKNEGVN